MSLIDPNLFKDEPAAGGDGSGPFAASFLPASRPSGVGFKDLRLLTRLLQGLLTLDVVVNLAFSASLILQMTATAPPEPDSPLMAALGSIGLAVTGIWLLRFIVMLVWFYRATKNARAVSAGLETTPGWAVGYFFVPILSLFRPYRTISEVWRSSVDPLSWRSQGDPAILRVWWGLYLASAFLPLIARLVHPVGVGAVDLTGIAAGIVENLAFFIIVGRVSRRQWDNRDSSVFD